jgi:hypothetical protein
VYQKLQIIKKMREDFAIINLGLGKSMGFLFKLKKLRIFYLTQKELDNEIFNYPQLRKCKNKLFSSNK